MGQKIPTDRVVLYCQALSDIGDTQLKYAFDQALKHLGSFLPSIQELRSYSEEWRPKNVIQDSRHILDRGDKPSDWEPLKPDELERMRAEARERAHTIERAIETAAEEHTMPTGQVSEAEWEARRRRQLEEFRLKNKLGGEA